MIQRLRWLSIPIGVFGCILWYWSPVGASIALSVSLLLWVRGNRLAAAEKEALRHAELMSALRDDLKRS